MPLSVRGRHDYEPERVWSRLRIVHSMDISGYGTQASLESAVRGKFRIDRYLGNIGEDGRRQIIAEALKQWLKIPPETKLVPLLAMRERGLLSPSEYHDLASQQGLTTGQSEYRYRKWTGTEEAIYDMKQKGLLRYSEFSKLLNAKKISRGAGYYRFRRHQFLKYGIPFRDWAKRPPKLRSKRKTML